MNEDITELIYDLLESVVIKDDVPIFTEQDEKKISMIANKCKELEISKCFKDKEREYEKKYSAEMVYMDMCSKIISAPTQIHLRMVPVLLIPILDKKLKKRRDVKEDICSSNLIVGGKQENA